MEHRAVDGPKANPTCSDNRFAIFKIIASQLSRTSLKFSFSRNNNYRDNRVIFSRKSIIVWSFTVDMPLHGMTLPGMVWCMLGSAHGNLPCNSPHLTFVDTYLS
jgi:hypothetical protein